MVCFRRSVSGLLMLVPLLGALVCGRACADPLAPIEREWRERLARRRPELALRLGADARRDRLFAITDVSLAEDSAWLEQTGRRLRALNEQRLTTSRRGDRRELIAWCDREQAATRAGGAWRSDPMSHVARLERALDEAIAWPGSACRRAIWATRRLTAVPDVLRGAQVALDGLDRDRVPEAAARLAALLDRWRGELAERAGECRDGPRFADFVVADTLALRAGTAFLEWLRDPNSAATAGSAAVLAPVDSLPRLTGGVH